VARVLATLGLGSPEALVDWVAAASKADVAGLAPLVAAEAAAADAVAAALLARAVQDLERHATAMVERLGPWTGAPTVALAGGLIGPGGPLREALEAALRRRGLVVAPGSPDPVRGAAARARALAAGAG
jgi:N-acetylglucosamine kinase-like BadF-type ATPase